MKPKLYEADKIVDRESVYCIQTETIEHRRL